MSYGLKFTVLESILQMNTQMHVSDWLICSPCLNIDQARFWFIAYDSFWLPYKTYLLGKTYSNESIQPQENARCRALTLTETIPDRRGVDKKRPWWFSRVPQKLIPSINIRQLAAQETMQTRSDESLNRCAVNEHGSADTTTKEISQAQSFTWD